MIKIDLLEKIDKNLETLGYEETKKVFTYIKNENRFDLDLELKEVKFYIKSKEKLRLMKIFTFEEFEKLSHNWIKQYKTTT
jgi:hypothetical protein